MTTTPIVSGRDLVPVSEPLFSDSERAALAGFLAGYSGLTREAYTLDLRQYTSWCSGSGSAQVACNGGHQRFLIRVTAASGKAFAKGTAVANANIFGCNNTTCGSESSSATIQIQK